VIIQVYRLAIVGLLVVGAYDLFTSFVGAVSLFNLSGESPLYFWGLPAAIGIGAFSLNLITQAIWDKRQGMRGIMLVWGAFLIYDYYTSYLGLANIVRGGEPWKMNLASIETVIQVLSLEQVAAITIIALIVVVSPMTAFVVIRRLSELQRKNDDT